MDFKVWLLVESFLCLYTHGFLILLILFQLYYIEKCGLACLLERKMGQKTWILLTAFLILGEYFLPYKLPIPAPTVMAICQQDAGVWLWLSLLVIPEEPKGQHSTNVWALTISFSKDFCYVESAFCQLFDFLHSSEWLFLFDEWGILNSWVVTAAAWGACFGAERWVTIPNFA